MLYDLEDLRGKTALSLARFPGGLTPRLRQALLCSQLLDDDVCRCFFITGGSLPRKQEDRTGTEAIDFKLCTLLSSFCTTTVLSTPRNSSVSDCSFHCCIDIHFFGLEAPARRCQTCCLRCSIIPPRGLPWPALTQSAESRTAGHRVDCCKIHLSRLTAGSHVSIVGSVQNFGNHPGSSMSKQFPTASLAGGVKGRASCAGSDRVLFMQSPTMLQFKGASTRGRIWFESQALV